MQDPCGGCYAVNSPPSPRDHRGLKERRACFCFRVWCQGKGQRRLCNTLSAVGYGGSINGNSLSNDESAVSSHDVTCMMRARTEPALRSPITTITGERPSGSLEFRPCSCQMPMTLSIGRALGGVPGVLLVTPCADDGTNCGLHSA
jgi:hypothetical protein